MPAEIVLVYNFFPSHAWLRAMITTTTYRLPCKQQDGDMQREPTIDVDIYLCVARCRCSSDDAVTEAQGAGHRSPMATWVPAFAAHEVT